MRNIICLHLILGAFLLHGVAADDGDDFSNNLFTDLAPILALFGERVTMQFMSQAMGWADHIILAMAPLGIVTAIVGTIRVSGPSWLKAVIGRARESRAIPEAELMSSTSHEVCELWNGYEIVRVMGKGPIREFIILPGTEENIQKFEAVKATEREHMTDKYLQGEGLTFRENLTGLKHEQASEEELTLMDSRSTIIIRNETVETPSLSLNVHSRFDRRDHYIAAICGIFLQLGVLLYFGFATYYPALMFKKDGDRIKDYAFPCTAVGTLCLAGGMMLCSRVVELSTEETRYKPMRGRKARLFWIQKAGTVNDQTFKPFAVFPDGKRDLIITSGRSDKVVRETSAILATLTCLGGFVVQFVGLRGMHWSAPVVQLGATIVMAVVRAWVRRHLAQLPRFQGLIPDFELDWLALTLSMNGKADDWSKVSSSLERPERRWAKGKEGREWKISGIQDPEDPNICPTLKSGLPTAPRNDADNWAMKTMGLRRDLGRLADWPSVASSEAICLARAIEATMSFMDPLFELEAESCQMTWSMRVGDQPIDFHLQRMSPGSWKALADELEAALSLWLYFVEDEVATSKQKHEENKLTRSTEDDDSWLRSKGIRKEPSIILLGSHSPALQRDMKWWMPDGTYQQIQVCQAKLVSEDEEHEMEEIKIGGHRIVGFMHGYDTETPLYRVHTPVSTSDVIEGRTMAEESFSPLRQLYTRYMFSTFMRSATKSLKHPIPGHAEIKPPSAEGFSSTSTWKSFALQNSQLSQLAQNIHATDIGTLQEVYLTIIPSLSAANKLPEPDEIVHWARKHSQPHEELGHWAEATDTCTWLFGVSKTYPNNSVISLKSTAMMLAHLQAVESALEVARGQILGRQTVQELETLKDTISEHLESADRKSIFHMRGLMEIQRAAFYVDPRMDIEKHSTKRGHIREGFPEEDLDWKHDSKEKDREWKTVCRILQSDEPYSHGPISKEDRGLTALNQLLQLSDLHRLVMIDRDHSSNDIKKYSDVNCRDVFDWTPLHYAASPKGYLNLDDLLSLRPDLNARDLRGRTPLHIFSQCSSADSIRRLLREGSTINIRDTDGRTPLHHASVHGHEDIVKVLVEAGADVNITDSHGNTPFLLAAYYGHYRLFQDLWTDTQKRLRNHNGRTSGHLVAMGTKDEGGNMKELVDEFQLDIHTKDSSGKTVLHYAAQTGKDNMISVILKYEAHIEVLEVGASSVGTRPLSLAAQNGHLTTVGYLLEKGADIHGHFAARPLHVAAGAGHDDIVTLLLDKREDINIENGSGCRNALHFAAEGGHAATVELLLEKGANKESETSSNERPIHLAARKGHHEVVKVLLHWKVDIDARSYERTPIFFAAESGSVEVVRLLTQEKAILDMDGISSMFRPLYVAAAKGHLPVVELLLGGGALIEGSHDHTGRPLHKAASSGHLETVKLLIRKGADKDSAGFRRGTALHHATENGHFSVVEHLLGVGANASATDEDDQTLLHYAAKHGYDLIAKLLLDKGSAIDSRDKSGRTPLSLAAESGHKLVVRLLLDRGAEVDSMDNRKRTPLSFAARSKDKVVVGLLLRRGARMEAADEDGMRPFEWAEEAGDEGLAQLLQVDNSTM